MKVFKLFGVQVWRASNGRLQCNVPMIARRLGKRYEYGYEYRGVLGRHNLWLFHDIPVKIVRTAPLKMPVTEVKRELTWD